MSQKIERQLNWNKRKTELYPAGTVARVGDISFVLQQTKENQWRVYLELHTNSEFGVKTERKRGILVAEYKGKTLQEIHIEVEKYLTLFIGQIMRDWAN